MTEFEICSLDIRHNIKRIQQCANGIPIWAVIKFDGYGTGMLYLANILRECGITNFAVSRAEDVEKLREAGFQDARILLICQPGSDDELRIALQNRAIFSVGSICFAKRLKRVCAELGAVAEAHVTVDTGMGRFGFLPKDYDAIQSLYLYNEEISFSGIYSHFYYAHGNPRATKKQFKEFVKILHRLKSDGIDPGMAHICNSAATFRYPDMHLDAVRVGSAILGRICGMDSDQLGLKKIGTLKSDIAEVKFLPKGHQVGYGSRCQLDYDSDIAVVNAGRWAGTVEISRKNKILKHFPVVEINGTHTAMVCPPGMGHSIIDVTGLIVRRGDVVRMDLSPLKVNGYVKRIYV